MCKRNSLFYLIQNCYVEPPSCAFDLCILNTNKLEVPVNDDEICTIVYWGT